MDVMVWYGMVWYGMVWYGTDMVRMVWYGMVWCGMDGMVWYGVVWCGVDWFGLVWCGLASHGETTRDCGMPAYLLTGLIRSILSCS